MKKVFTIISLLLLIEAGFAATAASFLDNGIAARSEGLGRAFTAVANDLDAFYYNPAGYAGQAQPRVNTMGTRFNNEYDVYYAGAGAPLWSGYGAFNYYLAKVGDIPETILDINNQVQNTGSSFEYASQAFFFSYGFKLQGLEDLSLGINLKQITEKLYGNKASGAGVDAGLIYTLGDLRFGYAVLNLVEPQMKWDTDSGRTDTVERKQRLGLAYQLNKSLLLALDMTVTDYETTNGLGLEFQLNEMFALRMGSFTNNYAFGLGLNFDNVNLDYVFIQPTEGLIENTHKVSLGYVFGAVSKKEPEVALKPKQIESPAPAVSENISAAVPEPTGEPAAAAPQINLVKRNIKYADGSVKCYYRLANQGTSPVIVKTTVILLSSTDKVIAKKTSSTIMSPQAEDLVFQEFTARRDNYRVKCFVLANEDYKGMQTFADNI